MKNTLGIVLILSVLQIAVSCGAQTPEDSKPDKSEGVNALSKDSNNTQVEWTGIAAVIPDHSEKANGTGVIVKGEKFLFHGEFETLPDTVIGQKIHVVGKKVQKNWPMFIQDPKNVVAPQGIPMPPGTDIEKESIYHVIENPVWQVVE